MENFVVQKECYQNPSSTGVTGHYTNIGGKSYTVTGAAIGDSYNGYSGTQGQVFSSSGSPSYTVDEYAPGAEYSVTQKQTVNNPYILK